MGHAFLYYFNKKVFYLKMLSAIKSVASMADEKNMSLAYWWIYTGREGDLSQYHFLHHKTHTDWPGIKLG
jgi:hypothetical protein